VRSPKAVIVPLIGVFVAVALVGCSSSNGDDSSGNEGGGVTVADGETGTPVTVEVGENADGTYFMNVGPSTVAAGPVTFTMNNTGTGQHEMVVLKTDTPADQLEVDDHRVSEADSAGEVGETDGGETGTVTLDLEPGNYVLVCNIANHYEKHMYSPFTVT
jgi:uncharacterized cupredoxin-like copper-binding protein